MNNNRAQRRDPGTPMPWRTLGAAGMCMAAVGLAGGTLVWPIDQAPSDAFAAPVKTAAAPTLTRTPPTNAPSPQAVPQTRDGTGKGPASGVNDSPAGMVWIDAATFTMGSTDPLARSDEQPPHRVRVDGFWIDTHEVTNREYKEFVDATGYVTVAERAVEWEELSKQLPPGTPQPPADVLKPGSIVFTPTPGPVDLRNVGAWWRWTIGASWKQPEGPGSSIEDRMDHPVIHMAFDDAAAYAAWAGKRLPTEAEWELAARGGLDATMNVWGQERVDATRANIWSGDFPFRNDEKDGYVRTAPVGSYPANGFGLYDVAGNAWEWCVDRFDAETYARRVSRAADDGVITNPVGPDVGLDPNNPFATNVRVIRGGSFLCNDSYCASYRPSARMAADAESGASHLGFRCVRDRDPESR
ncbi:MAG: formylglycine-generating enzyme family protein [Planctomycetota bacterium]